MNNNEVVHINRILCVFILCMVFLFMSPAAHGVGNEQSSNFCITDQICEQLRNRLESAGIPPRITIGSELIHSSVVLPRFYENRAYKPAWKGSSGH